MPIVFVKQTTEIKLNPSSWWVGLLGWGVRIKMRQGRFVSAWVALTLQFSSVSVSSRSQPRAPGILPSPMPFGSRDFLRLLSTFSKAHILCSYWEPAFGLCMGITFPWNRAASFLSLPATHCRVCSSWRQAATSGCSLTGAGLPLMGKYRECFLTLNNFCKFCNLKYPEESCLHLSRSIAEVLSRYLSYQCS